MSGLYTLVKHWSGRGWMEIDLLDPKGQKTRLPLVMCDPRWGYQLKGYGQTHYSERPDGKLVLCVIFNDEHGNECFVRILASESEIADIAKEFRRHFRNKARRDRRLEAKAKKFDAAESLYVLRLAA
jgi:hypothetical protein